MADSKRLDLRPLGVIAALVSIALAILRATNVTDLAWWLVLSPVWGLFGELMLAMIIRMFYAAVTKR